MRKVIAGFNMTLDGFCDHTAGIADDELHEHYTDLLNSGGAILYGRITYQLMEYWPTVQKNPTGNKANDDFAVAIDRIPKIVFSNTLKNLNWKTATLAKGNIQEEINKLKQLEGKDIFLGSPSIIVACFNLNLIDEFQITVQPIILGKGLSLLKNIQNRIDLKLLKSKTFKSSGSITHYYEVRKKQQLNMLYSQNDG